MKITDKIISIPPYISTSWDKVSSLYMQDEFLVIVLNDFRSVQIPSLSQDVIDQLFSAHAAYLEQPHEQKQPIAKTSFSVEQLINTPLKLVFGTLDSVAQALQHNPTYSDLPSIPEDIAQKIAGLSKVISPEDIANMPKPESGCNCMYCQMARILQTGIQPHEHDHPHSEKHDDAHDEVTDEELRFEEWAVSSIGDKMYQVTNKLDPQEHYTVFLGDPIGCTCGKPHCEHVIAVLRH